MNKATHTHPCQECGAKVPCDGPTERNHDGWPSGICTLYYLPNGGTYDPWLCEDCYADGIKHAQESGAKAQ